MEDTVLLEFDNLKTKFDFPFDLKEEQVTLVASILKGEHSMGILGTGFGKSMTYVIPPLMLDMLHPEKKHASLVVSPLISLMMSQVTSLQEKGVSACAIHQMSDTTIQEIQEGKFSLIFASPEAVNSDKWNMVLRKKVMREMICLVAIDEAHCVIHWGETFREDYKQLTWMRPVLKETPFLFLTATCTGAMKQEILTQFSIEKVTVAAAVPNRPNLYLTYKSSTGMRMDEELTFYIEELKEKGQDARKCIIYTRVNPAGEIFEEFMDRLRDKAFTDSGERLIDVFVAKSTDSTKEKVMATFPKTDSYIRCLVASSAFGMGVDIPDVDLIIHWGVSPTVLDYWQEVGRAGRDERDSEAVMLATPITVSDKRITKKCMRDMHSAIKNDNSCIRLAVLKGLYLECMDETAMSAISDKEPCKLSCTPGELCKCTWCICCSNCRAKCICRATIV